jgi:hypothetical protein
VVPEFSEEERTYIGDSCMINEGVRVRTYRYLCCKNSSVPASEPVLQMSFKLRRKLQYSSEVLTTQHSKVFLSVPASEPVLQMSFKKEAT